jgi:hypothetical protein
METVAQMETVENELHVFHRSHCAWKTRQKTAEFPTVSTASTAGHSDEEKRKTIARTVQSESSRQEAGESVKNTSPGPASLAGFEVIIDGRFSGAHRGNSPSCELI